MSDSPKASGRPTDRGSAITDLQQVLEELGTEELRVLHFLAKRLRDGQARYGKLDLAKDPRDLARERSEELADALVYTAMAEVQRVVRADTTAVPQNPQLERSEPASEPAPELAFGSCSCETFFPKGGARWCFLRCNVPHWGKQSW